MNNVKMKEWKVIYTRPRREHTLAKQLSEVGYEVYLPYIKTIRQWKDRKKKLYVPMFTSYLFVRLTHKDEHELKLYRDFVTFVKIKNQSCIVRDEEINFIKTIEENEIIPEIASKKLCVGQEVIINDGLFKGYTGHLTAIKGKHKLVLSIDILEKTFVVEINGNVERV